VSGALRAPGATAWDVPSGSPVADLIDRHREEMRKVWQRHVAELRCASESAERAATKAGNRP
jgi:hypothetical protein